MSALAEDRVFASAVPHGNTVRDAFWGVDVNSCQVLASVFAK